MWTYSEEQGWHGGVALHMDHGKEVWQLAFLGSYEEQPGNETTKNSFALCEK